MELSFRHVLTVTELTQGIKETLEQNFFDLWVEGEVSNLRIPPSGHLYFTLKDDFSQIRGVLFKMRTRTLRFLPQDGLHVICRGRVGLYEKRGEYQLILEEMEPKGVGALQLAFLQLKERLEKEGLFDAHLKKPIPYLPLAIGVVTSPTGAAIRDMVQIIHRRFKNVRILLYPARVQGDGAASEIADGITFFNEKKNVDVIIVGRGGGSIEDLWAFNEERVARAIYASGLPVISAVGHETDYTISDFVADLRAPTPSAAAELVVRDQKDLKNSLHYLRTRLESQFLQNLQELRSDLSYLRKGLVDPVRKIEELLLRVDDLFNRTRRFILWDIKSKREKQNNLGERLCLQNPAQRVIDLRSSIFEFEKRLDQDIKYLFELMRQKTGGVFGKLDSLSPLAILQRGYSITRRLPTLQILRDATLVEKGDQVEVKLHKGTLRCHIETAEGP